MNSRRAAGRVDHVDMPCHAGQLGVEELHCHLELRHVLRAAEASIVQGADAEAAALGGSRGCVAGGPFATPEAMGFLKRYQAKAAGAGVDVLGYFPPPFAYAEMQVLQAAVEGTKSLDQEKLADYLRSHTFHAVIGDITFGPGGEWTERRIIEV